MAFWNTMGKEKGVTEPDSIIRGYTESVMHTLQEARQEQQPISTETDQFAMEGKYSSGGEAYWEAQYAAPGAMQQYGFCKTASQKYGSLGSQMIGKPGSNVSVSGAIPPGNDAQFSSPAVQVNADAAFVKLGSRYLDTEEAAERGERIPVLDNRASVDKTILDDIARRSTLRKLSTLATLLERQKMGLPFEDTLRLPRVAMVTLKARKRGDSRRDHRPVPCNAPGGCVRC